MLLSTKNLKDDVLAVFYMIMLTVSRQLLTMNRGAKFTEICFCRVNFVHTNYCLK